MFYLKKAMLGITALALSFGVHSANFYFYNQDSIDTNKAEAHADTVESINDKTMDFLFPYVEVESTPEEPDSSTPAPSLNVPANMTYSDAEFSKFSDTYLGETADAGENYFEDIVFCGDSLTYGLGLDSRYLGNYSVVAWGGLGVYDYLDFKSKPCFNKSEELKSPIEWLTEMQPSVVYIMLGTNGIAVWSNELHINLYNEMLDRIESAIPNATIVLVGIPAWASFKNTETFNGQKVDNFNMMLLETAYARGHYYLNFGDATRDENGNIRDELCSTDGIHWQKACKELYLKYIRTHTIFQ